MTTIITRKVNNAGPYAYRVEWVENDHEWEYLGAVGKVDPADLSDEENAQLREEGFALARYRDETVAEFHKRAAANTVRDHLSAEFGDDVLAPGDDRRSNEIELAEDAPPDAVEYATGEAAADREQAQGPGQADLTRDEIRDIDFSRENASIPHAQASKAALQDAGISNWRDRYNPEDHPSPSGHAGDIEASKDAAAERGTTGPGDKRMDQDDETAETGVTMSPSEANSRAERHALQAAQDGDDAAAEALVEEFGRDPEAVPNAAA